MFTKIFQTSILSTFILAFLLGGSSKRPPGSPDVVDVVSEAAIIMQDRDEIGRNSLAE
jgi:hypothetical protein